ncbi:unnamed protein product [Arctia plantaginis]|uniref:Uncharacterized protein n=1 Tax=Arctia plantaginis TaxID=874455 RepID=A0A8S0YLS4_ARCPL|nr:unnamed protein product [Arctia plantaginis]
MLHETWHKMEPYEIDALFAEVNNNCIKEDEAECGAETADSPPPLPPFGYAPGDVSPSHSRSYQELRPAHAAGAAHARDMQAYAHLEEALFKGGSTDGAYMRRSSPDSPSPERRDEYSVVHYEPYTPQPPPYAHEHHHVDSGGGGGAVYTRCAYGGPGATAPYFSNGAELTSQTQIWTSSAGGSPSYGGSTGSGGGVVLEEYSGEGGPGSGAGSDGGGGSLPAFSARFGGGFACATARAPSSVYSTSALPASAYSPQEVWNLESNRRPQISAAASLSACKYLAHYMVGIYCDSRQSTGDS